MTKLAYTNPVFLPEPDLQGWTLIVLGERRIPWRATVCNVQIHQGFARVEVSPESFGQAPKCVRQSISPHVYINVDETSCSLTSDNQYSWRDSKFTFLLSAPRA